MWVPLVESFLRATNEALKLANAKQRSKYIDKVTDLKFHLLEAESLPLNKQDDGVIEDLIQRIIIANEALEMSIKAEVNEDN